MKRVDNKACLACKHNLMCFGAAEVDDPYIFECASCFAKVIYIKPAFLVVSAGCPLFTSDFGYDSVSSRVWHAQTWKAARSNLLGTTSALACSTSIVRSTLQRLFCPKCTRTKTKLIRQKMLSNVRKRMFSDEHCISEK